MNTAPTTSPHKTPQHQHTPHTMCLCACYHHVSLASKPSPIWLTFLLPSRLLSPPFPHSPTRAPKLFSFTSPPLTRLTPHPPHQQENVDSPPFFLCFFRPLLSFPSTKTGPSRATTPQTSFYYLFPPTPPHPIAPTPLFFTWKHSALTPFVFVHTNSPPFPISFPPSASLLLLQEFWNNAESAPPPPTPQSPPPPRDELQKLTTPRHPYIPTFFPLLPFFSFLFFLVNLYVTPLIPHTSPHPPNPPNLFFSLYIQGYFCKMTLVFFFFCTWLDLAFRHIHRILVLFWAITPSSFFFLLFFLPNTQYLGLSIGRPCREHCSHDDRVVWPSEQGADK